MTQDDNKTVVRRFYDEVMGQGNVELLDQLMAENFVDHGEALFGSPQGRAVLRDGIAAVHSILAGLNIELHEMIAEDDLVGVRGTMRCRHAGPFLGAEPTGHELIWQGLAIFRIEDGRIAERWFNSDSITLVRQLGLATPAPGQNAG
ncbi:MAG: ester cyclase [Rhodospirillales bacterium]|nr:ester cyclase [Rhodospirillales bacterium]